MPKKKAKCEDDEQLEEPLVPLSNYGLTKIDDVEDKFNFRKDEIEKLINIISIQPKLEKNQYSIPIIVGKRGTGKSFLLKALQHQLHNRLTLANPYNEELFNINLTYIIQSCGDLNSIKQIINNEFLWALTTYNFIVIEDVDKLLKLNTFNNVGYIILEYINEMINTCYGGSNHCMGKTSMVNSYVPRIIFTCESKFYDNVCSAFHISKYFKRVDVKQLDKGQCEKIILNHINNEYGYNIKYQTKINLNDDNIKTMMNIIDNSDMFNDRKAPQKYIDGISLICTSVTNSKLSSAEMVDDNTALMQEFKELKTESEMYISSKEGFKNYVECLYNINSKKEELLESKIDINLTSEEIYKISKSLFNVSNSSELLTDKDTIDKIKNILKEKVIGQDDAIDSLLKAIRKSYIGLNEKNKTKGNFMFIGPTGVGKTHIAKTLANAIYGDDEEGLVTFSMNEFMNKEDVNKLLGAPAGYIGYNDNGLIYRKLKNKPHCIILLDEIEKAAPAIYDTIMQMLDEGYITSSNGEKTDITDCIVIMTSNVGAKMAKSTFNVGFNSKETLSDVKKDVINKSLNNRFSPEFLNRIDNICMFNSLNKKDLNKIYDLEITKYTDKLKAKTGIENITISKKMKNSIIEKTLKDDMGARPLKRYIEQDICNEVIERYMEDDSINEIKVN